MRVSDAFQSFQGDSKRFRAFQKVSDGFFRAFLRRFDRLLTLLSKFHVGFENFRMRFRAFKVFSGGFRGAKGASEARS